MSLFNTIIIAIAIVAFGSATDTIDSADVGLNANLILADSVTTSSVCNKGCVDCRNGFEVIDGAITKRSCYVACGGSCCIDGNGYDACHNFSGLVCKDGSCNGTHACRRASIELVINSCIGVEACMKAGSYGGSVGDVVDSCHGVGACFTAAWKGSIDTIENSCHGQYACQYAAANGGSIDTIENSCNYGNYNCYQLASYEGSIGHILSSCSGTVNARVNKACAGVGREEPTGDILSCCNGEDEVCCQNGYACRGNIVKTLPEDCASDFSVGIRGFARRFADE